MAQSKRERHRLERDRKRKERQRRATQTQQGVSRRWRGFDAADLADQCFRAGKLDDALTAAVRAISLAPDDVSIAGLYVTIAERARALQHRRRALEHYLEIAKPNVTILLALAEIYLQANDDVRAAELLARTRAIFPRRMRDRRVWFALLLRLEAECGARVRATETRAAAADDQLPLFHPRGAVTDSARLSAPPPPDQAPANRSVEKSSDARRQTAQEHAVLAPHARNATAGAQRTSEGLPPPEDREHADGSSDDARREESAEPPALRPLQIAVTVSATFDGLHVLSERPLSSPEDVHLAALAALLRDAESFDRLLALENARGLLRLSHQEETARRVLSVHLGRALLADEVGLGKTIEAGLVLSEYLLRGRVHRGLILTPPSLVGQWREELAGKFGIATRTTEDNDARTDPQGFWSAPGVLIASLATARSARHQDIASAQPWDLVIVDEAHTLKNARTQSYAFVSRLTTRFLLLLTATPIENHVEEIYNLVSLLRPGHLGGRTEFVRRFGGRRGQVGEVTRREVRALLGEVMIRNTRALSGVHLPPRFAHTMLIEPQLSEHQLYAEIVSALRALGPGGRTRQLLSLLLQEAGSSPFAVRGTLERLRSDAESSAAAALAPAVGLAHQPLETGKGQALVRLLQAERTPTVVFTRFRATLAFLTALLAAQRMPCERIDGDVPASARQQAIDRCRDHGGVLLSTDVGSEGLNLQFCHRLVNFDLPWNPMRIEQRIGRVHRIGQEHPVDVINFCLAGSIEERILRILDERINLFELVVGEAEMILGYLEDEREFADVVFDTFAEPDAARREHRFTRIGDALAAARTRYEHVKLFDESFFRNALGV